MRRTRTWTFDVANIGAIELVTEAGGNGHDGIPDAWEDDELRCRTLALAGQGSNGLSI
jgi:hypothetical protein